MTSSWATESSSEIPDRDVITADENVVKDVTDSTKPKVSRESTANDRPPADSKTEAVVVPAKCTEIRSAFSRSPEQIWQDPPKFQGNENYGFEMARWAAEQQRK